MIINHNITALNTHNKLSSASAAQGKSMEKLASGLRINKAGDDAAGLAISEKMRAQVRGLDQASRNSQDGISLIQTAEGALNETHDILQRMRELSVQSANDTNTDADRTNIQDEVNQLGKEIDRIRDTTQFNTKNLLNGSMDKGQAAAVANVNLNAEVKTATVSVLTDALTTLTDKNGNNLGITATDVISVSYVKDGATVTNSFTAGALTTAALGTTDGTADDTNTALAADASGNLSFTASTAGLGGAINGLTITVKDASGNVRSAATNALSSFTEKTAAANVNTDGQATFQIGANTGQNIQLALKDMGTAALGVKDLKSTQLGQNSKYE